MNKTTAIREIVEQHTHIQSMWNDKRKDGTRRLKFIPMNSGSPASRLLTQERIRKELKANKISYRSAKFKYLSKTGPYSREGDKYLAFVVVYDEQKHSFKKKKKTLLLLKAITFDSLRPKLHKTDVSDFALGCVIHRVRKVIQSFI